MSRPTLFPRLPMRIVRVRGRASLCLLDSHGAGLPITINPRAWRPTSIQSVLKFDRELTACLAATSPLLVSK